MVCNNKPVDNVAYIPSCITCIDMVNNIHRILDFGYDIMSPNGIDISRQYEFGLNYIYESPNDSTQGVHNTERNTIKYIQCNNKLQCLNFHHHYWHRKV